MLPVYRQFRPPGHRGAGAAFTITEIMLAVTIISLLAALSVPGFIRAQKRAQKARFVNDLRIASGAFHQYATENGGWPPDVSRGQLPAGMDDYFGDKLRWAAPTPIGGQWDWDYKSVPGMVAGITVDSPEADDDLLEDIDKQIDDGDLNSGSFRRTARGITLQLE